jgi:hypothetical protein
VASTLVIGVRSADPGVDGESPPQAGLVVDANLHSGMAQRLPVPPIPPTSHAPMRVVQAPQRGSHSSTKAIASRKTPIPPIREIEQFVRSKSRSVGKSGACIACEQRAAIALPGRSGAIARHGPAGGVGHAANSSRRRLSCKNPESGSGWRHKKCPRGGRLRGR